MFGRSPCLTVTLKYSSSSRRDQPCGTSAHKVKVACDPHTCLWTNDIAQDTATLRGDGVMAGRHGPFRAHDLSGTRPPWCRPDYEAADFQCQLLIIAVRSAESNG